MWSDSSFNILPPFSSFPPWQTSLEPVIFLLILCLGRGGVHIFTRAAALTLFKSSEPRYLWLYLLNWVLSRLSSRQSPLTRFIAFWESLLAKLWCWEAHKPVVGPGMSVPHLTGNRGFREPLSLDRHTSSFTSVFWLWKTPQVSPNLSLTALPVCWHHPYVCTSCYIKGLQDGPWKPGRLRVKNQGQLPCFNL